MAFSLSVRSLALLAAFCLSATDALVASRAALSAPRAAAPARPAPIMQFGKKKLTAEEKLEEMGYWPGEWLCADCGFIYEPGTSPPFEELKSFWKCPQVGELDDTSLYVGTAAAFVVIFGLVYVALTY